MQSVWLPSALFALLTTPVLAQYGGVGGLGSPGLGQYGTFAPGQLGTPAAGKPGWEIRPTLAVEETYTDNARLASRGSEQSDFVTALRPGLFVGHNGPRARFNISYAPQLIYRAREETKDIFHYLNAAGNAELMQQLLFIDASATVTQQNVSLLGPQAQSNINDTGNRTSVGTYRLSPYLRHNFGYDALGEARLTHTAVRYGGGNSSYGSDSNRIDLQLLSGPAYKLLTWYLAYNKERIDYSQAFRSIETEVITASARRLITPSLGLRVTGGYENNDYITFGPPPRGKFWSVGPEWTPTPRTRIAATTGRRYFGPTHSVDASHRTRLTTWGLNYTEEVTTTGGQALIPTTIDTAAYLDTLFLSRIPDPVARQAAVQSFIGQTGLPATLTTPLNFLTAVPFLQKRLVASFGVQGVRNTVLTTVFRQSREATAPNQLGAADFSLSTSTRQTGASVLWTSRISALTSSNVSVSSVRSTFPGLAREDKLTLVYASLVRQFQPRVSGSVTYRRLQSDSSQNGADYKENAIVVALNMRF